MAVWPWRSRPPFPPANTARPRSKSLACGRRSPTRLRRHRTCGRRWRLSRAARPRSASSIRATPRLVRQDFDEADAARDVAREEDAVRVGRVDVDPARIGLGLGQRELDPLFSARIKTRDLVDHVLADPDIVLLLV